VTAELDASIREDPLVSRAITPTVSTRLGDDGNPIETRPTDLSSFSGTADRNKDGSVSVTFSGNHGLPFNPVAPGVTFDISVTQSSGGQARVKGSFDGFPRHTLSGVSASGQKNTIFQFDGVKAGNTPLSLFPPSEVKLDCVETECPGASNGNSQ